MIFHQFWTLKNHPKPTKGGGDKLCTFLIGAQLEYPQGPKGDPWLNFIDLEVPKEAPWVKFLPNSVQNLQQRPPWERFKFFWAVWCSN